MPPCDPLADGFHTYFNISKNQTGGVATFQCDLGFRVASDSSFFVKTCLGNGTWVPVGTPRCEVVTCPAPKPEENAEFETTKAIYYYNDVLVTKCSKGALSLYIEPGTEETPLKNVKKTCQDNGEWTKNELACLLVQCPPPLSYEISNYRSKNSSSELNSLYYGKSIIFECDWSQGFEPDKNESKTFIVWRCNENSTWDKDSLKCAQSGLLKALNQEKNIESNDNESSTIAVGSVVLSMLGLVIGIIFCFDYMTISRDVRRFRHNWSHFTKHLRDQSRSKRLHEIRQNLRNEVKRDIFLKRIAEHKELAIFQASGLTANAAASQNGQSATLVRNPLQIPHENRNAASALKRDNPIHQEGTTMDMPSYEEIIEEPGEIDQK